MAIPEGELEQRLDRLDREGLRRSVVTVEGAGGVFVCGEKRILNLSSNDYLDLAGNDRVKHAAADAALGFGAGATASRLMAGNLPLYDELEHALAALCGGEAALIFGSGFLGNLGVLGALCRRQDAVFADKLNHASLIDGMLSAGCDSYRYRHNDMAHLEKLLREKKPQNGLPVIVSDTVFSMDGDIAPVEDLVALAEKYQAALVLDEAHAIGVFGAGGGVMQARGLVGKADLLMGTLSKALGSYGGFAVCSRVMRDYLINRARTFIFSTGLPPAVLGGALESVRVVRELGGGLGRELLARSAEFRRMLTERGLDVSISSSQIIPVMTGDNHKALTLARALREHDVWATAIRPPTVPVGTSRLRMSVTLAHSLEDLGATADLLAQTLKTV